MLSREMKTSVGMNIGQPSIELRLLPRVAGDVRTVSALAVCLTNEALTTRKIQ